MGERPSEIQVTYGVKELLALHNDKLDRIESKVDAGNMRTAEALATIEHRVTVLEQRPDLSERVGAVEAAQAASSAAEGERRTWQGSRLAFWGIVVTAACSLIGSLGTLVWLATSS